MEGQSGDTVEAGACNVNAYVIDPDPAGLNVRTKPENGDVFLQLPPESLLTVVDAEEGWLRLARAESIEGDVLYDQTKDKRPAWAFAKLIGTSTRTEISTESFAGAKIYAEPNINAKILSRALSETGGELLDCSGSWVKVRIGDEHEDTVEGWLAPDGQCPNPVTTCP